MRGVHENSFANATISGARMGPAISPHQEMQFLHAPRRSAPEGGEPSALSGHHDEVWVPSASKVSLGLLTGVE
jgi:hypothetical protein